MSWWLAMVVVKKTVVQYLNLVYPMLNLCTSTTSNSLCFHSTTTIVLPCPPLCVTSSVPSISIGASSFQMTLHFHFLQVEWTNYIHTIMVLVHRIFGSILAQVFYVHSTGFLGFWFPSFQKLENKGWKPAEMQKLFCPFTGMY